MEGDLQREFAVGWGMGRDGGHGCGGMVGGGAYSFGLVGWCVLFPRVSKGGGGVGSKRKGFVEFGE